MKKQTAKKFNPVLSFCIFGLFFLSCASVPQDGETYIPKGWTVSGAVSAEELVPEWVPYARGIEYFAGQVRSPKLELWALRVDLASPDIEIVINDPELEEGYIYSTTVSLFVETHQLAAGINANPFSPVSQKLGEPRLITGITINDGVTISEPDSRYDTLLIYDDGLGAIASQNNLPEPEFIRHAVGGFNKVLENGEVPEELWGAKERHPRSAVGLNDMGDILYVLAIDGRRPGSVGPTLEELGIILRRMGASSGLNLDGGGSTQLALRWPNGKVRTINKGSDRAVATCLGIRLRPLTE
jgi:hypothetical protein